MHVLSQLSHRCQKPANLADCSPRAYPPLISPSSPYPPPPRPQVLQHLSETGYRHELEPGNDGVVRVYLSCNSGGNGGGGGAGTAN